jgi:hypothetical protein
MQAVGGKYVLIIDRFEGAMAVIEYEGRTFNLPRNLLPSEAKEGDVIRILITVDNEETEKRRKRIQELMDDVFES